MSGEWRVERKDQIAVLSLHSPLILGAAYQATAYHVDGPTGRFTLRLGAASPEADALLARHGEALSWAFVTASNPGSVLLPEATNGLRHEHLVAEVARRGLVAYPGLGVGDDGSWPAEVSLFLVAVCAADAAVLGRMFGQNAVVCGDRGGVARLCWLIREAGSAEAPGRRTGLDPSKGGHP
jgi:hypothetical protein